jgi:hypothetical protein
VARALFVTDQWGYGTTTSARSIAAELRGWDTRWLIGEGAGFALARRDSFDECIPANTMAPSPPEWLKEAVRESSVVVSVMNPNAAEVADQLGVPCVYVDMLPWMFGRRPGLPRSVKRYFAEGFTWAQDGGELLPGTELIAPLIAPPGPVNPAEQADVLVNFGGLSSWLMPEGSEVTYACTMVECVVEALARWPGRIRITAGEHILNPLDSARLRLARDDVRFVSLSQTEYLGELEHSRCLISSPGLHATQEAVARGIPCLLLPSQNLSQALAVRKLHRAGAAFALDWDAIYGLTGLSAQHEARSCQRIAACIHRFQADALGRAMVVRHLAARLAPGRLEHIAAAQAAFFRPGRCTDGPQRVASYVRHLVGEEVGTRRSHEVVDLASVG